MATTIIESLHNAEVNVSQPNVLTIGIAAEQIKNARILLEKGYPPETEMDPLLEEYETVEDIPDFEPQKGND